MLRLRRRPGACGGNCATTPADLLASIIIWIVLPPPSPFSFPSSSLPLFNRHAFSRLLISSFLATRRHASMGLVNRVVGSGEALGAAIELGHLIAAFPQVCLRNDRMSAYMQVSRGGLRQWLACEKKRRKKIRTTKSHSLSNNVFCLDCDARSGTTNRSRTPSRKSLTLALTLLDLVAPYVQAVSGSVCILLFVVIFGSRWCTDMCS